MPRRDAQHRSRITWISAIGPLVAAMALVAACAPSAASHGRAAGQATEVAFPPHPTPRLSAGCTSVEAAPVTERMVIDGRERIVLARVPPGDDGLPRDLVIAFHGRTNDAARARHYFELDDALPDAIVVYPRALATASGGFAWSDPGDPVDAQRDFALVRAVVETFGRTRCLDLDRVFVVGHSLGAVFANDVACRMPRIVRAVASVAGGIQAAPCGAGTAALLLHHPDDPLVPISAGERARDAFRAANGLGAVRATPAAQPALAALRCERYGAPGAAHPVVWCPHDDATTATGRDDPHTWPTATGAAIATFFEQLP